MTDSSEAALGRVRWKRFAALAGPAVVGAGALVFMTAQGSIASSFAVSGSSFKVHADSLDGTGFVQYGGADAEKGGAKHLVQISGIKNATITKMCQSVKIMPGVVLRLTAGDNGTPVEAENLTLDVAQLDADAVFKNIEIGRDASTMDKNEQALGRAGSGMFGQQADEIHLKDVKQVAWATTAGTFKLNHLSMKLGKECF
ncbi:DUF6230 family protein [Actinomadura gamaensis]|uniref:DUF6230 family protein n=1 Tax=Actinomadura gamaensis TaxID=1763541 RepID=A0ABV9U1M9_9ACTN